MQEFNSISQNRKNIFFIVLRQSRASTRNWRLGLFSLYRSVFAFVEGIFFVNASQMDIILDEHLFFQRRVCREVSALIPI